MSFFKTQTEIFWGIINFNYTWGEIETLRWEASTMKEMED